MEKIPSPSIVGRLNILVAAGILAIAAAIGLVMMPSSAFAENGSVTITASPSSATHTYKVYQIFTADVDSNNVATNVAWNQTFKSRVLDYIQNDGYSGAGDAQSAAEYISAHISAGPNDTGANTTPPTPARNSFALGLAQALIALPNAPTPTATATSGSAYTNAEGLYLFIPDTTSISTGQAGTAPIWVPLKYSTTAVTITEKNATGTVTKQVKDDNSSSFGKQADANVAQELSYKITGTLPDNVGAFDDYHYTLTDVLGSGMAPQNSNTSSVTVKVGGTDVTSLLVSPKGSISYNSTSNTLVVDIADLFTLKSGLSITKDTTIVVEYNAHLVAGATTGSTGVANTVTPSYPIDPVSKTMGNGTPVVVKTYAYRLKLRKVDKFNGSTNISGAKFTIQVKANGTGNDSASAGKYVQANGSLGTTAYQFTTDANGFITVSGLDSGTYVIHEVSAPSGYAVQDSDITVTITPTFNASGALSNLAANVSGGESGSGTEIVTHLATASDSSTFGLTAPSASTGEVGIVTSDDRTTSLPLTGLDGVMALTVCAVAAVLIGLMGLFFARKRRSRLSK